MVYSAHIIICILCICMQVDMPVFFYIDPEFNDDPALAKVDTITLSYTFFEAKEGEELELPLPNTQTWVTKQLSPQM